MIFPPTKSGDLAYLHFENYVNKNLVTFLGKFAKRYQKSSPTPLRSLGHSHSPLSMIWCYKTKLDFKSHSSSKSEIVSILVQFPSTVPVSSNFSVQSPQGCASFFIYHGYIIFYID